MLRPSSPALRPFQEPVVAKARDANVVMVGATGIGKTFVAVALLAQQRYDDGQRAFVLAPTRQLVWQITAKVCAATTLRATALGGRTATDHWDAREWGRALAVSHVVVCTPDVLRSALERAFVRMAQINLLVLDECHHVSKRHPYAQLTKLYAATPASERPRVFGATATPTRDCARRLHAEILRVELPVDETVACAAAAPVQWEAFEREPPPPPTPPQVVAVGGSEPAETELERWLAREFRGSVYHRLYELLTELQAVQVLRRQLEAASAGARSAARLDKAVQRFVRSCAEIYARLGVWCVYRYVELEVERAAASASQLTYVPGSMFSLDSAAVTLILLARRRRAECAFDATARLKKVVALLEERLALGDDQAGVDEDAEVETGEDEEDEEEEPDERPRPAHGLQGIIFVTTRAECRVACEYLNERLGSQPDRQRDDSDSDDEDEDKQTELLAQTPRFACMLGQAAARDAAAFGLAAMEETLVKFEAGEIACVVSTAVSVEGVDFPQCALLIVASRVETARMLLQLRGRARHQDGVMYYLGEVGDRAHEMHLRAMLREAEAIAALDFRHDTNESVFAQPRSLLMAADDEDAPSTSSRPSPYKTATGAVLDLDSSVARLNAFCQTLPKVLGAVDLKSLITYEETTAAPVMATTTAPRRPLFCAHLQLPAAVAADAPVFESAPLHSKATAKAAVAFAACKFLHERGLLDDAFHSVYRKRKPEDLSYLLRMFQHE